MLTFSCEVVERDHLGVVLGGKRLLLQDLQLDALLEELLLDGEFLAGRLRGLGAQNRSREDEEKGRCEGACHRHVVLPFPKRFGVHQIPMFHVSSSRTSQ